MTDKEISLRCPFCEQPLSFKSGSVKWQSVILWLLRPLQLVRASALLLALSPSSNIEQQISSPSAFSEEQRPPFFLGQV